DQVGAVVHRELRTMVQSRFDVLVVGLVILSADRISLHGVVRREGGGNGVIGGQRVGRAQRQIRASGFQREHQVCRLAGDVKARSQTQAFQRLIFREALPD